MSFPKEMFFSTTNSARINLNSLVLLRDARATAVSLSSFPFLKKLALLYLTYPQEEKQGKKVPNTVASPLPSKNTNVDITL